MHNILWELLIYSSLVLFASALLHYMAYKKGVLTHWKDESEQSSAAEQLDEHSDEASNPLIEKWLTFGGGYYGIIAFSKLIIIEISQAFELASNWPGIDSFLPQNSLNGVINMFVNFFVAQYTNFAEAISWPAYYLSHFSIWQCALFVVITYLVYLSAQHLAWRYISNHQHEGRAKTLR